MALRRRNWIGIAGVVPVIGVATVLLASVASAAVPGQAAYVVVPAIVLAGIVAGVLLARGRGPESAHRRVDAVRTEWARGRTDAERVPDGTANPRDTALALPRGWRVEIARGRLRFRSQDASIRVETWVLRPAGGSRRDVRRREIVGADVPTGAARMWFSLGSSIDPLLVTPTWAGAAQEAEPSWAPAVRDRARSHDDVLAALTVGDDRVILFAVDDPRPETMLARAQLVSDVAALVR